MSRFAAVSGFYLRSPSLPSTGRPSRPVRVPGVGLDARTLCPESLMRTHPLVAAVTLLATLGFVACRDDAPTATRTAAPSAAAASLSASRDAAERTAVASAIPVLPVGFTSVPLARGSFRDEIHLLLRLKDDRATKVVNVDDPSDMVMSQITVRPNFTLPWHTHPGPAFVTVKSGALTVVDGESCAARTYTAGESFVDPGNGHVHVAYNVGAVDMVLYVTYLDVPAGQSPLIPAANPGC